MNRRTSALNDSPLLGTLRKLLKPAHTVGASEQCELCCAPLPNAHGHLVDTRTRRLLCACAMCNTLGGRYRPVPTRYTRLSGTTITLADWDALAIPVDLAFFFFNSDLERIVACYPGPGGAAESLLPLEAWPALVERHPAIGALAADVEALLVRREDGEYAGYIVPIDACYELVGRIRGAWTGFGGGHGVSRAIDEFFAAVLAKTVKASTPESDWAVPPLQEGA